MIMRLSAPATANIANGHAFPGDVQEVFLGSRGLDLHDENEP